MALSGSVSTSSYEGRYYQLSWTATQNVANNTSTISWTLKAVGGTSSWYAERTLKVVIAGATVHSKTERVERYTGTVATGTKTITHNSDGTKSFSVSVQAAVYGTAVNCTGSDTFTLNTIARKSTLSVANGTLGTAQTLTISEQASSFKHKLTYSCGSASGYILGGASSFSTSNSVNFTPPKALASQNTTGTKVSITFKLDTYTDSGTLVGSNSYTKDFTIPSTSEFKPSCTIAITDTMGYKGTYGKAIKGLSKFKIVVTPKAAYNSGIVSYKITANGATYTTSTSTTGVLINSGTVSISATVTDGRGRTGTTTVTESVYDYNPPVVSKLSVNRCNSDGTTNEQGAYIKATFSGNITSLDNKNSVLYKLHWKKTTDSTYTDYDLSGKSYGKQYTVTDGSHIFEADTESSFDVKVTATDNFQASSRTTSASTAYVLFDFGANGNSVGIGKVAELSKVLDIGFKTRFYGGILQRVLEAGTNFNDVMLPNTYTLKNAASANYTNCPFSSGTGLLKVESFGEAGQVRQVVTVCNKTKNLEYERFYYENAWGEWVRKCYTILYDSESAGLTTGASGNVPLSETSANFSYLEIFFTDNNNRTGGYTKVYSPNGKTVHLSIVEPASATQTYIRRTWYTISGAVMSFHAASAGYVNITGTTLSHTTGTNYLRIVRVVGRD